MLYVALVQAAAVAVIVLGFLGYLRSAGRAHARREDLLVNQLCSLAGHPWQPAPAAERFRPEPDLALVQSPEQWPEDDFA